MKRVYLENNWHESWKYSYKYDLLETWNDLRENLAEYVELKRESGDITYAARNIFNIKFKELFDCALITEIIEHGAHPDKFLKSIANLIKPGGYIIMITPNGEYIRNNLPKFSKCINPSLYEDIQFKPDSDGHIFLLYYDEICTIASEAKLVIRKIRYFTNPLTHG